MQPSRPLKVFHELTAVLRQGSADVKDRQNGIFRGITNSMPGYWTIVGVTRKALEIMSVRNWRGEFTKDLRRDHMKSGRQFQEILMTQQVTYEDFCQLVEDYGRCVVCTSKENPPRTAGYGHTYFDSDIVWLPKPLETSTSMTVPATRATASMFRAAWEADLEGLRNAAK
jgi:hypothetical protein